MQDNKINIYLSTDRGSSYKRGFKKGGFKEVKKCVVVCKNVEHQHSVTYYAQLAQVMAEAVKREAKLVEACRQNPDAVKLEDFNDNDQDLDTYVKPVKGIII